MSDNLTKQAQNELIGRRITECLEMKHLRPAELIRRIEKRTESEGRTMTISRHHLSRYMHGKGHLPQDKAIEISKELDIYEGYLFGDAPLCKTYSEYMDFMALSQTPNFQKYDKLLNYARFALSAEYDHNGNYIYGIGSLIPDQTYKHKDLPYNAMQAFYEFLCSELRQIIKDNIDKFADSYDFIVDEMNITEKESAQNAITEDTIPPGMPSLNASVEEWLSYMESNPDYFDDPFMLTDRPVLEHFERALQFYKDCKSAGRPQPSPKRNGGKKNEKAT